MDNFTTINAEIDTRGVVHLTLNRPEKKNALSAQMIAELTEFAGSIAKEPAARVVVLRGAGDVFCAGGDLDWMKVQINADRAGRMAEARKLAHMLQMMNELALPMIGAVHGGAFGGGVGMACVCDLVIAESGTKFGLTETRLGLIPATISPYVVARMGEGKARRVFMSARIFSAAEAQALDLIADQVPAAQLEARIEAEIKPYLKVAPRAVGASKALARALGPKIDAEVIEETVKRLADTWEGVEAKAGIDAFLNKTAPPWT
ncbi:crotonase/enoyl-CoA hydratase family protein [Rhodobacteraceae bacterium nBUS_24]